MATANVRGTTERQDVQPQQQGGDVQKAGSSIERAGQGGSTTLSRGGDDVRSPFGMMRRMFEDMDRLFSDFGFGLGLGGWPFGEAGGIDVSRSLPRGVWSPQIEVREQDGKLLVHADLPGLKPDDIHVDINDDVLTISGERKSESKREEGGVFRSERSYGRFERRFALPKGLDPNAVDAKFDDGVLQLTMPLPKNEPRGRRIEIKGGSGARELGGRDTQQKH